MALIVGFIALAGAFWFASRRDWAGAGLAGLVALVAIPLSVSGPAIGMLLPLVPLVCVAVGAWYIIGRPRRSRRGRAG